MSYDLRFNVSANVPADVGTKLNNVKTQITGLGTAVDTTGQKMRTVGSSSSTVASNVGQVGTASATATTKLKSFATSISGIVTGLGTAATGAIMLWRSYRDLSDYQIQVEATARKLSTAQEAQSKAQQKVNDLVAAGKKDTPEYKQAILDLEQANMMVSVQTKRHGEALEAQSDALQNFAVSIVPTALGVVGTLASTFSVLQKNSVAAGTGIEAVSKASKLMTVLKIAAPLAAIAAAYMAIRTNAFGCRDALDAIGKSIGDQIPALKPLLTWLKDLGTALGLTGKALDLSAAWKIFSDGATTAFNAIKNFDWGKAVSDIATSIETALKNWNWAAAWQSFKDALWSTNAWVDEKMVKIQTAIVNAIKNYDWATAWKTFQDALYSTGTWITEQLAKIGTAIITYVTDNKDLWWEEFKNALGSSVEWVADQMKKVGQAILDYGWKAIGGDIWKQIGQGISDAIGGAGEALGGAGKATQDAFGKLGTDIQKELGIIPSAFTGAGGGGAKIVNEMMGTVQDLTKGAGGAGGGGLGIAQMFATEMKLALQFVTQISAQISAQFLNMKNSITITMTALQTLLGAFASTALTTIATAVSTQTTLVSAHFLTMKNSVTITITALQTLLGAFASTTLSTIATAVSTQTTVMSAAFLTMKTSVSTQIIALQTLLGAFASTTLSAVGAAVTQQTTNMSASFLAMKTSVTGSITQTQTALTTFSNTVSTTTSAMTTKINSFASAMQSAMDKITKSMDTAKKSADALKKSIDALKDKTITITTRYVTSGSPAGQHGYQGIIGAPGNVGGVKVGEGFRPELITVTPLTRGTGNHYGATMGGGFGSPGGRGGGEVVNNITVVLDGRVIQRFVEKTALAGIGVQI